MMVGHKDGREIGVPAINRLPGTEAPAMSKVYTNPADGRHAPTPSEASRGKERIDRGQRLAVNRDQEGTARRWFCRSCGQSRADQVIPEGWYSLARHRGEPGQAPVRLGVYCSAWCLATQMPRIVGIEEDAAERWQESEYHQRRAVEHQ